MKISIRITIFAIIFFLSNIVKIYAQNTYVNLNFLMGFPQQQFKENVDNIGYGGEGSIIVPLGDSPFSAGINLGVLFFDSKKRSVIHSEGGSDIKLVPIRGSILAHLLFRMQISGEQIRPYVEGLFGLQHFFTKSAYQYVPTEGVLEEGGTPTTEVIEMEFSGGVSCGCMILLHKSSSQEEEILLDFRLRYLYGGKTKFVENYHQIEGEQLIIDTVRSRTDLFTIQIGASVTFGYLF